MGIEVDVGPLEGLSSAADGLRHESRILAVSRRRFCSVYSEFAQPHWPSPLHPQPPPTMNSNNPQSGLQPAGDSARHLEALKSMSAREVESLWQDIDLSSLPEEERTELQVYSKREAIRILLARQEKIGDLQIQLAKTRAELDIVGDAIRAIEGKHTIDYKSHSRTSLGTTDLHVSNTKRSSVGCLLLVLGIPMSIGLVGFL
jgi:hypothetical protein